MRTATLLLLAALPASLPAQDEWAVHQRANVLSRQSVMPDSSALVKSLGDAAEYLVRWKPPASAAAWARRRPEVARAFRASIGLEKLPERTPLNARITARHDLGDYTIENVIFESRPGFPVTANLYRPKARVNGRRPAVLSPIGHYLGPGKTSRVVQSRAIGLVRMGFVVLTYDAIGQGERMQPGNIHHEAGYALLPLGETIAGWMVWDSMRAIDYLASLPDVDPARIGVTGNSGGGLNTLYTAALDGRVRAAVVVGYTFEFRHWVKYAGTHCACTHLPGVFRGMEWFEIAGLIAPRPLMLLQGENDAIFPIEGARGAARNAAAIYRLGGNAALFRLGEVPGQPHDYSQPYRERMYGWMARHLMLQGVGEPLPETPVEPLPEYDRRLLCDPDRAAVPKAPTVVQLAQRAAAALNPPGGEPARSWLRELAAPPENHPHFLSPQVAGKSRVSGGALEKISFVSEAGQYVAGLLWIPDAAPRRSILIVDGRGKAAVAESGLAQRLMENGFAVLALDLRGRGEMLERHRPEWDINYRLTASQVLSGRPLAARRAFDLTRAIDYLSRRGLPGENLAVAGIGEDALPALLAAAVDERIRHVAMASYWHSFISQMRERVPRELPRTWNDPQLRGRVDTCEYEIDFGSVIPGALRHADVPEIAALIAPRRVLFCQARDNASAPQAAKAKLSGALGGNYQPAGAMDAKLLLDWLR